MTDNKLIFWVCDYSDKTGEGNLARKFISENFKKEKIKINTLKLDNFLNHKYIIPFVGIISCWKHYFKGNGIGYINYLPLWNFFIFFLYRRSRPYHDHLPHHDHLPPRRSPARPRSGPFWT